MSNGTGMFYFFSRTFLRRSPVDIMMAAVLLVVLAAVATYLTVLTCTYDHNSFIYKCSYWYGTYVCMSVGTYLSTHLLTYLHMYLRTLYILFSK